MVVDEFQHKNCNGCKMCADICPVEAITFREDELTGFWYPIVEKEKCINCGICAKKCPQRNPVRKNIGVQEKVYASWSRNDDIRMLCTSGGLFYEIADVVIKQSGVVVACSYTQDYRGAYHCMAKNEDELIKLCGSKHVQSDTSTIYKQTKELLENYNRVLFVGTPCQVAGLYSYLESEPENLLTVDFICNSINSPKAQAYYIDYLENVYGSKLIYARSKDKRYGWTSFGSSAKFENGEEYYADRNEDARVVSYHSGHLFIRESCTNCQYKALPRNADLTLGDFWGIEENNKNPKLEMGTSVVIANSEKGKKFFLNSNMNIDYYEKSIEDAIAGNPALLYSVSTNGNEKKAFHSLEHKRFDKVVKKYKTKQSIKIKIKTLIKKSIEVIKGDR